MIQTFHNNHVKGALKLMLEGKMIIEDVDEIAIPMYYLGESAMELLKLTSLPDINIWTAVYVTSIETRL
jgi:hypothetical protein